MSPLESNSRLKPSKSTGRWSNSKFGIQLVRKTLDPLLGHTTEVPLVHSSFMTSQSSYCDIQEGNIWSLDGVVGRSEIPWKCWVRNSISGEQDWFIEWKKSEYRRGEEVCRKTRIEFRWDMRKGVQKGRESVQYAGRKNLEQDREGRNSWDDCGGEDLWSGKQ